MVEVRSSDNVLMVEVRVNPGSKKTKVQGAYGNRLKVQLTAPPEGGKANSQLLSCLADWLEIPTHLLSIKRGQTSRDKIVSFQGLSKSDLENRIQAHLDT